jgi:hypothetical protein
MLAQIPRAGLDLTTQGPRPQQQQSQQGEQPGKCPETHRCGERSWARRCPATCGRGGRIRRWPWRAPGRALKLVAQLGIAFGDGETEFAAVFAQRRAMLDGRSPSRVTGLASAPCTTGANRALNCPEASSRKPCARVSTGISWRSKPRLTRTSWAASGAQHDDDAVWSGLFDAIDRRLPLAG